MVDAWTIPKKYIFFLYEMFGYVILLQHKRGFGGGSPRKKKTAHGGCMNHSKKFLFSLVWNVWNSSPRNKKITHGGYMNDSKKNFFLLHEMFGCVILLQYKRGFGGGSPRKKKILMVDAWTIPKNNFFSYMKCLVLLWL